MENTDKDLQAFHTDLIKIEKAISGLLHNGQISSRLCANLYAMTGIIAKSINDDCYDSNTEVDEALKAMEAKRILFAQEIEKTAEAEVTRLRK